MHGSQLAEKREKKKAIRKNKQKELTDESKSVSSLFMNNEILLPNRCHEGHQSSKSPVSTGFFEPMQLFKLGKYMFLHDIFVRYLYKHLALFL